MNKALPMPGDGLDGSTVVASCFSDESTVLLMLLNKRAPFYEVAEMRLGHPETVTSVSVHENINHATAEFADCGGDA